MGCARNFNGKYDMLYGRDEQLLSAVAVGAEGAVGSTYNYMPEPYSLMWSSFLNENDLAKAQEYQHQALGVISLLGNPGGRYGPPGSDVGRAMCMLTSGGPSLGPPRLPKLGLSDAAMELLQQDLSEMGISISSFESV